MFERVTNPMSKPPFIVDQNSIDRDTGRQIDWDALDSRYDHGAAQVVLTESVDFAETAITVEALTKALPAGTILDFGERAAFVVTLSANEAIAETSLAVVALPGPVRSGTVLKFGAGEFAELTADAAAGATDITVAALEVAIESGDTAPVPAVREILRVATAAAVGATAITVDGADMPIESGDIAYYGGTIGSTGAGKFVPAGTVMDLQADGQIVPSALGSAGLTAYCLLATNADEDSRTDSMSGYGVILAGQIYENLLPETDGAVPSVISSTWKTELRARGGSWMFHQYSDDTA